ncbi:hypothetical protein NEMBOFW57_009110 [Staphylotrichum longicolle]|uniref:GH16 domain-containing protein n=1 Tax=Staphylotrichum longicolle TaxID=669026 RepID=A0AAD4ET22_9PEZI|nr:hypothetical protein NEMBOFW57_009110 [Staphylotrichum longicolle]
MRTTVALLSLLGSLASATPAPSTQASNSSVHPAQEPSGAWTSARIESKATFTPAAGKVTLFEAALRFGDHPQSQKQGIWPAFWLLGDAIHRGTPWPLCGELDIMETVNGLPTAHRPRGTVGLGGNDWHTWTLQIDRTNAGGDWRGEVIRWLVDGRVFHQMSGADIGDQGIWGTLAHSPMFMILNVAVGGNWPGAPNGATADSYGSMMEVEYVAVYSG